MLRLQQNKILRVIKKNLVMTDKISSWDVFVE